MNWRNRLGIYGCYLCSMSGIGFTLPFLPLYLGLEGFSDQTIGWISTGAALSGLTQFPIGLWSDRMGSRKPFLIAAAALLLFAAWFLQTVHGVVGVALLVVLFAENGICRAIIESLSGAAVTAICRPDEIGGTLGSLRMWKPIGIIAVALLGGLWAERSGVGSLLLPVAVLQAFGFLASLVIDERRPSASMVEGNGPQVVSSTSPRESLLTDRSLWLFVLAMVLFHAANAPGGVYLGLHLKRGLAAPDSWLAYAFVVSMLSWMLVVWPCGRLADRIGRKPLLVLAWSLMAVRLLFVALCQSPWQIVANQIFDGASNGLFSVVAATWVTDRLADPRRNGVAQAIVGTSLVLGSAIGPAVCALVVSEVGYRVLFAGLAGVGALATVLVLFVPETWNRPAVSPVGQRETAPGL